MKSFNEHRLNDKRQIEKKPKALFFMYTTLIFIPFFKPAYLNTVYIVNIMYNAFFINTIIFTIIILYKNPRISKHTFIFIIYQIFIMFSSFLNHIQVSLYITAVIRNIILWIIVDYYCKRYQDVFLRSLSYLFSLFLAINLVGILFSPSGLVSNEWGAGIHFLESDNRIVPILLCIIMITSIYSITNKGRLSLFSLTVLITSVITAVLIWSGSGVAAIAFLLLHLIFVYNKKIAIVLNAKTYVLIIVFVFIGFVVLGFQSHFSFFIEGVLNKDLTFTNRVFFWQESLQMIKDSSFQNLMIGYGYNVRLFDINMLNRINNTANLYLTHSHSEVFEIILQFGVLGFLIFSKMIVMLVNRVKDSRNHKIKSLLAGIIFVLLLIGVFEKIGFIWFNFILVVAFNINSFNENKSLDENIS